jgi:protein TonB
VSEPAHKDQAGRAFAQCVHEPRIPGWLVTGAAVLVHAGLFAAAFYLSAPSPSHAKTPPAPTKLLEVELPPPPPPIEAKAEEPAPPPPEPEPVKLKVSKAEPEPPRPPSEPPPEPEEPPKAAEPPPAAAQASAALTANDEASDTPADTLVTGDGAHYAGGTTERGGTSTTAVQAPNARAAGVANGSGDAPVDRSQHPRLAAGTDWSCPFPSEAEEDGIDRATVGLEVEISETGHVLGVAVHNDPGSGFGREARTCALKKRWLPALDKSGQPIKQKHKLNVTFIQK